jgi:imidazolonepropionase-like amidohydrolase
LVQFSFSPVKLPKPPSGNSKNNGQNIEAKPTPDKPVSNSTQNNTNHSTVKLSGASVNGVLQGNGTDTSGNLVIWTATFSSKSKTAIPANKNTPSKNPDTGYVNFPFGEYGWKEMPSQNDILIKNATVWTSEKEGVLKNTDVFVKNGKISAIGKNLNQNAPIVIDGTGMHLTPGIVDEHSHIAVQSINEGGQSVTSEVRIGDNLDPEDIDIYRELAGGVTTAQILHGSANTIGGQSQLIKLRWGTNDTALKFENAPPFIKFALGENVKRTTSRNNNRFPNTRMGVEGVLMDAFTRARDYQNEWKQYNNRPKNSKMQAPRRDLELDALVDILNSRLFITSHSYIQSEILAAMRVAEKFGFRYNTFTHILEGYKVADEMKKHGVSAGTFSDWWNYKEEVVDAIPQNAAILSKMGINTAINSDDAEMARRLNQEAAKSVKYGISEEEAMKFVTINPATMLHVQDRIGSIKVGKDADMVLWTDNPLSVYAVPQKTIIDGIVYFDHDRDIQMREEIRKERNRLIQKFGGDKKPALNNPAGRLGSSPTVNTVAEESKF